MELVVLGCSGSVPGPESAASGYLLKSPQHNADLLMDIGSGVLAAMQRTADVDPENCHVVFSHMHADHCSDFPSLMVWRRWHPTDNSECKHTLLGPTMAEGHLCRMGGDYLDRPDDLTDSYSLQVHRTGTGPFDPATYPVTQVGDFSVYSAEAIHTTEAYMMRVEHEGKSVVYTGDTAWTESLVHIAQGADVLLAEATWGATSEDKPEGMHLSGQEAGRAARLAGVEKLILTHIPPWGDAEATLAAARSEFDGPIALAEAGMRVTI
ncbi:MBL fold metallo-hydrolase [Corynebacterium zhongnanshanii]|nr:MULTISPECIES: MBL fold metallo-hydrolase [Corynebacterium]QNP92675.1 MBL fold metallo-hydrolase [Corynebacterium zhongnanshanii]